jgi:hypothetical protein
MTNRWVLCCALALAFSTCASAAEKKDAVKEKNPVAKAAKTTKAPAKGGVVRSPAKKAANASPKVAKATVKARAGTASKFAGRSPSRPLPHPVLKTSFKPAPASSPVLHGPKEILTCRDGTEDRHARIAVVTVGGTPESFAYYSKWKPRTCSIYLQRNRDGSKWVDKGAVTNVSTDRGLFLIEREKGEYRFVFRDVDRERYCGMDGMINGTLTIRKGSERCEVAGIMEEGIPLGQAVAYMEQNAAAAEVVPAAASASAPAPAARRHALQPPRYDPSSPFPSSAVGMSD